MIILLVACLVLLAFIVRQSVRLLVEQNDFFELRQVEAVSDGKLTRDRILEYSRVEMGRNLFQLDLTQIRRNLEDVPLVRSVTVRRRLPDRLVIQVVERTPLARIPQMGGSFYQAVDREGFVLGPSAATPNLPRIMGLREKAIPHGRRLEDGNVTAALELIDLCDRTRLGMDIGLRSVDVSNPEEFALTLDRDDRAVLPRRNLPEKVSVLASALKDIAQENRRGPGIVRLDLRGDRVVAAEIK
jgi:cell division protein FtsQ